MSRRERGADPYHNDVDYRLLYEGSQASLADMATRQVSAAARTNKLRAAVLEQMRRKFPSQFLKAEKHNGRRLETLDDGALIAYLASFLEIGEAGGLDEGNLPPRDSTSLVNLRAALAQAGLGVPASAQSVEEITAALLARSVRNFNPPSGTPGTRGNPLTPLTPGDLHPAESADTILARLLGPDLVVATDLHTASADKNRYTPPTTVTHIPAAEEFNFQTASGSENSATPTTLTPIPGGWGAPPVAKPSQAPPTSLPPKFGGPITSVNEPTPTPEIVAVQSDSPKDSVLDRAAAMLESGVGETKHRTPALAPQMPLRPELGITADGSSRVKKSVTRVSRVTATAPSDAATFDLTPESLGAQIVTDKSVNTRIQALVATGVPIFTSSLIPLAGSQDSLKSWEESLRADDSALLRFVPPRKRHTSLGALIYPTEQDLFLPEIRNKPWPTIVKHYHGAKLFELGILMGYIGKDVISIECEEHVVMLRVKEPRGAAGIVVALEPDLSISSETRVQASKAITLLSKERLTMLAVMTTNEPAYLEIPDLVSGLVRDDKLSFSCPVVAAKSWEYAQSGGSKVEPLPGS